MHLPKRILSRTLPGLLAALLAGCAGGDAPAAAPPPPPAPVAEPRGGLALKVEPGGVVEFQVDLPDALRGLAGESGLSQVLAARVALAVPVDFDPARPWPILLTSSSDDLGHKVALRAAKYYGQAALPAGWIVLAEDPLPDVESEGESIGVRYALIKAALSALQAAWPSSAHWPVAFGGFSGGAKVAGVLGLMSAIDGRLPIGVFMGGCNQSNVVDLDLRPQYRAAFARYQQVPLFISSGDRDPIATPAQHRAVQRDFVDAGFQRVRLESYHGDHSLDLAQVRTALDWFLAQRQD